MVFKKPNSSFWYFRFNWKGSPVQESTRQTNKRTAEQMEAAKRRTLGLESVGIRETSAVPTVEEFAERFSIHVGADRSIKPRTVRFYQDRIASILSSGLGNVPMNELTGERLATAEKKLDCGICTVNRNRATLRRMITLLEEWDGVIVQKIKQHKNEPTRDRVVTPDEEAAYLAACDDRMRLLSLFLIDCGNRPSEAYQLEWSQLHEKQIIIYAGKGKASRRSLIISERLTAALQPWPRESNFVFPAPTKSGHANKDTFKNAHTSVIQSAGISPSFVPYDFRHTAITRRARAGWTPYELMRWAGHQSITTTMRYIHLYGVLVDDTLSDTAQDFRSDGLL